MKAVSVVAKAIVLVLIMEGSALAQGGGPGGGGSASVTVNNTESNPVPTTVTNTQSNPVPTRDANDPARRAFVAGGGFDMPPGQTEVLVNVATVPAGKRLVIETIEGGVSVQPGETVIYNVITSFNSQELSHHVTLSFQASMGLDTWVGVHAVRWYVDPNTTIKARVRRSQGADKAFADVVVSGYFVDLAP